jgi:hypothetical protein
VHVTHYGVTLDLGSVIDNAASGSRALGDDDLVRGLKLLADKVDLHHIGGEVWLDDQGRARQFTFGYDATVNDVTITEEVEMHFSDFGAPVTVKAPAAADVVPFSEVPNLFKGKLVES